MSAIEDISRLQPGAIVKNKDSGDIFMFLRWDLKKDSKNGLFLPIRAKTSRLQGMLRLNLGLVLEFQIFRIYEKRGGEAVPSLKSNWRDVMKVLK